MCEKVFYSGTSEKHCMRANLGHLFTVAEYAKKHNPSVVKRIATYSARIVELFQKTRDLANMWDSQRKEKHRHAEVAEDYAKVSNERLDILNRVTTSQEKLRCTILKYIEFLHSVVSEQ